WRFLPQEYVLFAVFPKKKHAIYPWGSGVRRTYCTEEHRKVLSIRRPENIPIINCWRCLFAGKLLELLFERGLNRGVGMHMCEEFSRVSIVHVDETRHVLTLPWRLRADRKSTRLNSSHRTISYAVFCLKKKKKK